MPPDFLPTEGEGILFLDELNSAAPPVQAAIYQLVLDRKIGSYRMPEGWRIVCAGNRISDKGIVFRLPSPLANRMVHLVTEARYDDFKVWAIPNGIHSYIIGFLGFRPDLLSQEVPKESETNPAFATPRSWTMLSAVLKNTKEFQASSPLVYGAVGYGAGVEFLSYIKVYKELPSIDAILGGEQPTPPSNPGALYALTSALIERYDGSEAHGNALLGYTGVLPVEFGVMLIKDALTKHEGIAELSAFDAWVEKHGEMIV